MADDQWRKQFEKAELAVKKHNYDYAIALYQQGLIMNPRAGEARRKLHKVATVAIQEKGGKPEGGMSTKMKVLKPETNAKKLHMQKKYEEELIELEKVLQHQPQNAGTLMKLGMAQESLEDWEGAAITFKEILELDNTHVEAARKLGKVYGDHLDDPEKAIEYWEKVKLYKPDDKEAGKAIRDLSAATMVRNAEKRKAQAGDESFRSMLKDEDEAEDLQKQAQVIRTDADRKRAIKFKIEEIKKDPKNSRLYRDVGALYQDLKMWDKAEMAYKKALQVNPTDLYAQEKIGQLKEARMDETLDELRERAKQDPSLQVELKQKEREFLEFKVGEYARRVKAHPTDYGLKLLYGKLLKNVGRFDDAIGQFQKSVKDPKQKVASKKSIGECFIAKELYDMAKVQFAEALDEVADKESDLWKEIKYNLALACEKNGDVDESLRHYQEIMATDIGYRDVSKRVTDLRKGGDSGRHAV